MCTELRRGWAGSPDCTHSWPLPRRSLVLCLQTRCWALIPLHLDGNPEGPGPHWLCAHQHPLLWIALSSTVCKEQHDTPQGTPSVHAWFSDPLAAVTQPGSVAGGTQLSTRLWQFCHLVRAFSSGDQVRQSSGIQRCAAGILWCSGAWASVPCPMSVLSCEGCWPCLAAEPPLSQSAPCGGTWYFRCGGMDPWV